MREKRENPYLQGKHMFVNFRGCNQLVGAPTPEKKSIFFSPESLPSSIKKVLKPFCPSIYRKWSYSHKHFENVKSGIFRKKIHLVEKFFFT
jgi:hypothetical protein